MTKKGCFVVVLITLLCIGIASQGSANTVSVYLEGIDSAGLEIGGFQLMLDNSTLPPAKIDGVPPPTFGNNFLVNGVRAVASNKLGLAADQPFSGEYWEVDTLIDNDDTDGQEKVRGLYGFDAYWDPSWNKLNDGLLLTLSSSLLIAVDTTTPLSFFYDYDDEIIENLKFSSSWLNENQTIVVAPVPLPPTLLLLGGGLAGIFGLKRRKRS